MDVSVALPLLGGLSPQVFMKRHWHKKPLLIRQAVPGFAPLLSRAELLALVGDESVQSRLVTREMPGAAVTGVTSKNIANSSDVTRLGGKKPSKNSPHWQLQHGPFARRALPPLTQPGWTLLLQGMDLHHDAVHALMNQFRFVPDARLDDLMISFATDGGGVGPHFDSYDVFLLQAHGQRRWRIGRQKDFSLQQCVPLKILSHFEPEEEYVLAPGDMLYLPPRWAHDGIAVGECMTYSIGFRSPNRGEMAREMLQRLAEDAVDEVGEAIYRDPQQGAVAQPGEIPASLLEFARASLEAALQDPLALARSLGEYLTEPKPDVWFEAQDEGVVQDQGASATPGAPPGVRLDRRSKMMFDAQHVFINGEGFAASGKDATLMRQLANQRCLPAKDTRRLSAGALELLQTWQAAGWLHAASP